MKTRIQLHTILLSLCLLPTALCLAASPIGAAFTYQGRLNDAGQPANGAYDLRFALFDAAQAGAGVGTVVTNVSTPVSNGLFTVTLDFGPGVFTGDARWLDIGVRTNGAASFLTLAPRQPLTPAPQALFAPTAGVAASATTAGSAATANGVAANAVTAAGIASGQVVKSLNNMRDNVMLAAGANLTLSPGAQTITLATPEDWHAGGNSGTTPGVQFLGTTDNQPLELKVNNQRAFRLQPGAAPSVIGGSVTNAVQADTSGATIGGGAGHAIGLKADYSTIGGGAHNTIESNTIYAVIAGGTNNQILTVTNHSAQAAVIGGGSGNTIEPWAFRSVIAGGYRNRIQYDADNAAIGGGEANVIGTNADHSVIVGGGGNTVSNLAKYATVAGGIYNSAGGSYSFAAGYHARALHQGSFVWADTSAADFASTTNNQFLIRSMGGVGINKTNPASALDVNGAVTANNFVGPGLGLTSISAASLMSGSVTSAVSFMATNGVGIGAAAPYDAILDVEGNLRLNRYDLFLREGNDRNHGLGWYGATKEFAGVNIDGPVLYGWSGGGLGATSSTNLALRWTGDGKVAVDPLGQNNGSLAPGLAFGASSGEGIASKRTAGGTQYGLDFYTSFQNRMSILQNGYVGIGTTTPSNALDVVGTVQADTLATHGTNAFEVLVNGSRALRIDSVNNLVAGSSGNAVEAGARNSIIAGGASQRIRASAQYGAINGGWGNTIGANTASSAIGGGYGNTVSNASYATIPGGARAKATHHGQLAYAAGSFSADGDAQTSTFVLRNQSMGAAGYYTLFLDGSSETKSLTVPVGARWAFDALLIGSLPSGATAAWQIRGVIKNQDGTTSFVGTPTTTALGVDAAASSWSVLVIADNGGDALVLQVRGSSTTEWTSWVATVRTVEVTPQ